MNAVQLIFEGLIGIDCEVGRNHRQPTSDVDIVTEKTTNGASMVVIAQAGGGRIR